MKIIHLTSHNVASFAKKVKNCGYVAIDTEFSKGWNSYFAILALMQFSLGGEEVYLLDPCDKAFDLEPIKNFLLDIRVTKVLHSCHQDCEAILCYFKVLPQNIHDTQVGAKFIGWGKQIGYNSAVKKVCGKILEKDLRNTNWLARPLAEKYLNYASLDVYYLLNIYRAIMDTLLTREDRMHDFLEECSQYSSDKTYQINYKKCWIKFYNKYGVDDRKLRNLVIMREKNAVQHNQNVRKIFTDEELLYMHRIKPKNSTQLASIYSKKRIVPMDEILKIFSNNS